MPLVARQVDYVGQRWWVNYLPGQAEIRRTETRLRERGISTWLVGLNPEVLAVVQRSPLGRTLGREALHFNVQVAVTKYLMLAG